MLVQLLLVSAVVMGLSHTIAKERIFDPLRRAAGDVRTWRGYLLACPYCASHWLAFVLVPLTGTYLIHVVPRVPFLSDVLDWFLSSILVTVVAAFLRVGFYLVDERQRLVRKRLVEDHHDPQPPLVQ
jgi:dolichyl-phosphate-mannose--protein O-mannosyl transferase